MAEVDHPRASQASFGGLAAARVAAQALGILWLFVAVRGLEPNQFGALATGIAAFGVFTVIGDAGVTWSLPKLVVLNPERLWSCYVAGVRLRAAAGAFAGLAGVGLYHLAGDRSLTDAVALGALIALASGCSEVGYVVLRSAGRSRLETFGLPGERLVFLVAASITIVAGGGENVLLLLYLATNIVTASTSAAVIFRHSTTPTVHPERLWTRSTQVTAAAFALLSLAPRLTIVLLSAVVSASAIGDFALGLRPVEQIAWAAVGLSIPFLPALHEVAHIDRGAVDSIARSLLSIGFALLLVPATVLLVGASEVVEVFAGGGRFDAAEDVLRVLAICVLSWPARAILGFVLLVRNQPGWHVRGGLVTGLLAPTAACIVGASEGVAAAALVLLAGELIGLALFSRFCRVAPSVRGMSSEGVAVFAAAVSVLAFGLAWDGLSVLVFGAAASVLGLAVAVRRFHRLKLQLMEVSK